MPRIRTIKPEFFRSPSTAKASFAARILYEAMWCWADDFGVGETNIYGLLGFAFCDEDQITVSELQSLLSEVQNAYNVTFYEVNGRYFYAVPSWDEHQKTQRRAKGKNPTPDDPDACPDLRFYEDSENATHTQGTSETTQGKSPIGTGEQGNRGTGEETHCSPAPPSSDYPSDFEEFWEHYPRKSGKRKALQAWKRARGRTDNETLIAGAIRYARDPNRVDQFTKYAEGWLNRDGWLDEPLPPRGGFGGRPTVTESVQGVASSMERLLGSHARPTLEVTR